MICTCIPFFLSGEAQQLYGNLLELSAHRLVLSIVGPATIVKGLFAVPSYDKISRTTIVRCNPSVRKEWLMQIPGEQRSMSPDVVGHRAGVFAAAIRDGEMELAWTMLSKETRGMRYGVWATRHNIDMQMAYRAAYDPHHPQRALLLADLRQIVLRYWPLEDLTDLGVAPTRYIDDTHAFAFLPFGVTDDISVVRQRRLMTGVILPMLLEDGQWQVDLPGWRFL
jgi:hypothetical protein